MPEVAAEAQEVVEDLAELEALEALAVRVVTPTRVSQVTVNKP